jgi:uncharacterized protein (TIGR04222 family)
MSRVLDLAGPQFLFVYAIVALWLVGLAALLRRLLEGGPVPKLGALDPYQIALLRSGRAEAIRVACLSLYDRGLLTLDGKLVRAAPDAIRRTRKPLEQAISSSCRSATLPSDILKSDGPQRACDAIAEQLENLGLVPTRRQITRRVAIGACFLVLLWWLALEKIQVAIERGRHNYQILILFALLVPVGLGLALSSRRTTIGARVLEDLKVLFARLRGRASDLAVGGASNELALLVGVFGFAALAGPTRALWQQVFPRAEAVSGGSSCSSSSCSSGSSCGSSCGGGGGCGGCGS